MIALHGPKDAGGWKGVGISEGRIRGAEHARIIRAAECAVERPGDRTVLQQQRAAPFGGSDGVAGAVQSRSRVAPRLGDQPLIAGGRPDLAGRIARTVAQQAVQQEDVEQANRVGVDPEGHEGIDVQAPDFDVLDAALAQRMQRALSPGCLLYTSPSPRD